MGGHSRPFLFLNEVTKMQNRKNFEGVPENDLIEAFKSGNNQALEVLINRHKDKIFTCIIILVKDRATAEDIFQEVFINVIEAIRNNKYTHDAKFAPWILRIAHNKCIDHFRETARGRTHIDSEDIHHVEDDVRTDGNIIKQEICERLQHIIDQMPPLFREVVVMRHHGNLSFKEIAKITNTSINTCLGRMRYALKFIQRTEPNLTEWLH
jgi:RNA polymerase sigma factor (sigma-70 family)